MQRVDELFDIKYGVNLELNSLERDSNGVSFVSRTASNNGVSAKVKRLPNIKPLPAGSITVAGGGSVMESFLQSENFYSGRDLYYLIAKVEMTDQQKLYYCACLRANRYRYNYGRQANKTLKSILIPSLCDIPKWVNEADLLQFKGAKKGLFSSSPDNLRLASWDWFELQKLFDIERGKGPRKQELDGMGTVPVVTSTDQNNGWTGVTKHKAIHSGNSIGVNRNGSVGQAFYQPVSFCSTEDVHVFTPKFNLNKYVGLFLSTVIRQEKYRFNYGRKWGITRMKKTKIKLPVDKGDNPDWKFMEDYIKSLPYSSSL